LTTVKYFDFNGLAGEQDLKDKGLAVYCKTLENEYAGDKPVRAMGLFRRAFFEERE
jgi:hypothetical protein